MCTGKRCGPGGNLDGEDQKAGHHDGGCYPQSGSNPDTAFGGK